MAIYVAADPLTRLTMEMVAHTLCADQKQQLRIDFQVGLCVRTNVSVSTQAVWRAMNIRKYDINLITS